MLSHEAQCDGIVAVGHDAVLCDALTLFEVFEYSYSSFFNIIGIYQGYCLMSGYIFECI